MSARKWVPRCEVCREPVVANDRATHLSGAPCVRDCLVCGKSSRYDNQLDRFYHLDGSDMDSCWVQLSRGTL